MLTGSAFFVAVVQQPAVRIGGGAVHLRRPDERGAVVVVDADRQRRAVSISVPPALANSIRIVCSPFDRPSVLEQVAERRVHPEEELG